MALLFLITNTSGAKALAIGAALEHINEVHSIHHYSLEKSIDVRPVTRAETIAAAEATARALFDAFPKEHVVDYDEVYSIAIQKGVNLKDDDHPSLFHYVTVKRHYDGSCITIQSSSVPLPDGAKQLVVEENYDLYLAWKTTFGDVISNKEVSLYEFITGKKEWVWMRETVENALSPLLEKNSEYYK